MVRKLTPEQTAAADAAREPMYGMSDDQEQRFFRLCDHLRSLGYCVLSEPLEGSIDNWLLGIERNLARIEKRLIDTNKAFRTRGRSKAARYYLTSSDYFDPGFGIHLTHDQKQDNETYAAQLARGVARWDAAFGKS